MTDGLYFCPASREVESATGGGFATCCDRPQEHLPMPDTAATAAVSEALSSAAKTEFKLKQQLAELNDAITWETACLNCSSLLTRSYEDYCRAEIAEALLLALGCEKCSTCGNWVEPYGMVLHFRAEHATAEDLAESAPLRTPATQAGAVAGPATRSEEQVCLCCTFGNHNERCTCDGKECCHPEKHKEH